MPSGYPQGLAERAAPRAIFTEASGKLYRRHDLPALREFARRLTFAILISNGDAHFKNWSLIYPDRRIPTLSLAYDFV